MRVRRVLLLSALLATCTGGPADSSDTGSATTTSSTTGNTTSEPVTGGATDANAMSTTTGEPPTTGATTDETTAPVTGSTGETASDPGTSTSGTTTGAADTSDTTASPDTTGTTGPTSECTPGDTRACYAGPANTENVGLCAAGEQLCTPQGEWGPCTGEVLPAAETCVTPGDESCDGVDPCGGAGVFQWDHVFGAAGTEQGVRVAFDGAGNVVLAASGTSSVDLGGGALVSAGGHDIFLGKFAPDGAHLWSKRFGDAAEQISESYDLTVASTGEIVLTGHFAGTVDFGGGPFTAQSSGDGFLVEFSPAGAHVWSKAFKAGASGYARPEAVTRDGSGDILLAGFFYSSLDVGGGVMSSAGTADAFVGKFDADGKHLWSRRFGDNQPQFVLGLAADLAGNVYVSGGFNGTIDPGSGPLTSVGGTDMFLARLDPLGNAVWGKRFGAAATDLMIDLAVDTSGKIVATGDFEGVVDFGGGGLDAPSVRSFVAQFDSSGAHQWSRLVGAGSAISRAGAVDSLGQILLTGYFVGSVDFGGGPLVSAGNAEIFALKLDPTGKHVWSRRFGDLKSQSGFDIAGSPTGDVAVTGRFDGSVELGGGPRTSKGGFDGFIAMFGP